MASIDAIEWPVQTERLSMRPATVDDLAAVWAYRQLDAVNEWLTTQRIDRQEFEGFFRAEHSNMVVVLLDDQVIGNVVIETVDGWAQMEISGGAKGVEAGLGWVIHPDFGGRGYGTEAVREVVRICFDELGLRRVVAGCFVANIASWRLMERIGMRRESHTVRSLLHRNGEWMDGYGYGLLAHER